MQEKSYKNEQLGDSLEEIKGSAFGGNMLDPSYGERLKLFLVLGSLYVQTSNACKQTHQLASGIRINGIYEQMLKSKVFLQIAGCSHFENSSTLFRWQAAAGL